MRSCAFFTLQHANTNTNCYDFQCSSTSEKEIQVYKRCNIGTTITLFFITYTIGTSKDIDWLGIKLCVFRYDDKFFWHHSLTIIHTWKSRSIASVYYKGVKKVCGGSCDAAYINQPIVVHACCYVVGAIIRIKVCLTPQTHLILLSTRQLQLDYPASSKVVVAPIYRLVFLNLVKSYSSHLLRILESLYGEHNHDINIQGCI